MADDSHNGSSNVGSDDGKNNDGLDYETLAREMGWRPEGEFRGKPENFIDAKAFYDRSQTVLPIVTAANKALHDELARVRQDARQALEIANRANEREKADLLAQIEAAKQARKEAINTSDGDAHELAEARVKELEAELARANKPPVQDTTPTLDPGYLAWLDRPEQAWFKGDEEAQAMAEGLVRLAKYKPLIGQREKLWDAVVADVKKKNEAIRSSRADLERPGPEAGGRGNNEVVTRAGERSYANLSKEAKEMCDGQFNRLNVAGTLEKYRERYAKGAPDDAFRRSRS